MPRHLLLRLEAPLMSFGAVAVDHRRPVQAWPAVSMLTGLLGNALGWTRTQADRLDALQARIRWTARIDRPGELLEDFQTALLSKQDQAWTTRNVVETRGGGDATYESPHLRYRDYRADASVLLALRLEPAGDSPNLDDLAAALDRPMRPLFLGRKGCPPATRIVVGTVDGPDGYTVLTEDMPLPDGNVIESVAIYSNEGGPHEARASAAGWRVHSATDERRFGLDIHAGWRPVYERVRRPAP